MPGMCKMHGNNRRKKIQYSEVRVRAMKLIVSHLESLRTYVGAEFYHIMRDLSYSGCGRWKSGNYGTAQEP